jgi:plastocyanin
MLLARSVVRVAVAVGVFAASGLVWNDLVGAAGKDINATADAGKCDKQWGPPCFTPANGTVTQINQGETVTWKALDGTHTVSPADGSAFAGSGDLVGPDATFSVTFDKPGSYSFYCKHHGSVEDGGKIHHGMWGKIEVKAGATPTSAPPAGPPPGDPPNPDPAPAPSPGPAQPTPPPSSSPPPPSSSNGSTAPNGSSNGSNEHGQTAAGSGKPFVGPPPTAASPPPSRVASSPAPEPTSPPSKPKDKERDDKGGDNASPPEATAVPPDEAVLPPSPQFPTATTAPLAEAPSEIPQGDTVALIKNEAGGHKRRLILFITAFGMGAFALGVGGWKFTHRSSKYWPA